MVDWLIKCDLLPKYDIYIIVCHYVWSENEVEWTEKA